MHKNPKKEGLQTGEKVTCFYHHHNTAFFGLAKNDHKLIGIERKKDWKFPTGAQISQHRSAVKHILQSVPTPGISITTARVSTGQDATGTGNAAPSLATTNSIDVGNDIRRGDNQRRIL